jgi:hypothetical protein
MIEHEQLLKFTTDEDDFPVVLYLAKVGVVIDWKDNSPDEALYIPEEIFQSVASQFVHQIGSEKYYDKTILNNELLGLLCGERESGNYSNRYIATLSEIRQFVSHGLNKKNSHYLAFEGP